MVDVHPRLASFAPRPPTPPKERIGNIAKLEQDSTLFTSRSNGVLDTPEESPSSSAEYFGGSSERVSKRVNFSPWTKYHKPPGNSSKRDGSNNQIRILPPSRDCKSSKSILKTCHDIYMPAAGDLSVLSLDGDITSMLESAAQHLASPSRNSRVDAYTALLGCLSAYDGIPDLQITIDKLIDLLKCVRRDVLARTEENGVLDTQLVTQALKLLTALVSRPDFVRLVPDDFCSFIIEQSLLSVEDHALPKIVVIHYMHFVVQQKLPPQYMNADRINRLMKALDGVVGNIKGNRIVGQRLMVYKRLLTEAKSAMISCGETWIGHLISGMLSTFRDVRSRAIAFGIEASLSLGTVKSVSQAFLDTLNRESPEGRKVADFLASRLTEMASSKDEGNHVPQMWSVVILFLRSRRRQLEGWQHLKSWLLIIQKCFNSSDTQTKFQANLAWSRLIFAINLDPLTSPSMVRMLRQPIATQLDRKSDPRAYKTSKYNKQIARSSYCTLLYYAFRPSATHTHFDQYWNDYIWQMLPSDSSTAVLDIDHSCNILTALFSSTQPKIWDENRANLDGPVKADELPCIDSKWIRSRSAEVLKVFQRLFQAADWHLRQDQEAPILLAWRSFGTAIGEAGRKEVKVSIETMTAIAHMLNTLQSFWLRDLKQKTAEEISHIIKKIDILFNEAVIRIGLIPFNEKRLAQSSQNSYEATETPSSRFGEHKGPSSSSFVSLLNFLVSTLEDCQIPENFELIINHVMSISMSLTTTRKTQISILKDFAQLISSDVRQLSKARVIFWQLIAKSAESIFGLPKVKECSHGDSPQYTGHDYKDVIKIMEVGVLLRSTEIKARWQSLGSILIQALEQEMGDESVNTIFIEPLAETITQSQSADFDEILLSFAVFLLKSTKWSSLRHEKHHAHKLLGDASLTPHKHSSPDHFNNIFLMVDVLLKTSYTFFEKISSGVLIEFLSAATSAIASCPPSLIVTALMQIQKGIAVWTEDGKEILAVTDLKVDYSNIFYQVKFLWAAVINAIKALPTIDSQLLSILSILITSGLDGRHEAIMDESIMLWNSTFGLIENLEYPNTLQPILLKLGTVTRIYLPNIPKNDSIEIPSPPIHFTESEIDKEPIQPYHCNTPIIRVSKSSSELMNDSTARGSPQTRLEKQGPKITPKRDLRRKDPQVRFTATESSPLAYEEVNSQAPTNIQKKLEDSQGHEVAVIFSNLGSTSKAKIRKTDKSLPKLCFTEVKTVDPENDTCNESPVLPGDESFNDCSESSPTPRSHKRPSQNISFENRPCSSLSKESAGKLTTEFDGNLSASNKKVRSMAQEYDRGSIRDDKLQVQESVDEKLTPLSECSNEKFDQSLDVNWNESVVSEHGKSKYHMNKSYEEIIDSHSEPAPAIEMKTNKQPTSTVQTSIPLQGLTKQAKENISSELMPKSGFKPDLKHKSTSEVQNTDKLAQGNGVTVVINSYGEVGTTGFPNEEDQIAAQLVRDMEQRFSQHEVERTAPSRISRSSVLGKRKNASDNSAISVKKPKVAPQFQNVQVLVKAPKSGYKNNNSFDPEIGDEWSSNSALETKPRQTRSRSRVTKTSANEPNKQKNLNQRARSSTSINSSARVSRAASKDGDTSDSLVKLELVDEKLVPHSSGRKRQRSVSRNLASESKEGSRKDIARHEIGHPYVCVASSSIDNEGHLGCEKSSRDRLHGGALPAATTDERLSSKISATKDTVQLELTEKGPLEKSSPCSHKTSMGAGGYQRKVGTDIAKALASKSSGLQNPNTDQAIDMPVALDEAPIPSEKATPLSAIAFARVTKPASQKLLDGFRSLLDDLKRTTLEAEEEREMIGLLCHSLQEVHEAGRRRKPSVK